MQVEIDRTFPLAEVAAAHAYIESRQAVGTGLGRADFALTHAIEPSRVRAE